jgi:hypothetical protein
MSRRIRRVHLAPAIGACYAGLYLVSNYGEALSLNCQVVSFSRV